MPPMSSVTVMRLQVLFEAREARVAREQNFAPHHSECRDQHVPFGVKNKRVHSETTLSS